jgi:hypothetical protein
MSDRILCPDCGEDAIVCDSTYSTETETMGIHTGDIYDCRKCGAYWLMEDRSGCIRPWYY